MRRAPLAWQRAAKRGGSQGTRLAGRRLQRLRRRHLHRTGSKCEDCGNAYISALLQLHHRNGNVEDNSDANIVVLCSGCHRLATDPPFGA
jgi:5-methylcytosine-specific restriction endonuclease McrA